jgi:hypothetical protein
MRFFDEYPRFYETTATLLKPNRFEQRWRMIIEKNAQWLRHARVLDLASHDGRWSFASLKAGATYVEGVEARPELVRSAIDTFTHYEVDPATYAFCCEDAVAYLAQERLPAFDVVLNLGFFYHTMRHMELLENMARTGAKIFIIDTGVLTTAEPIIHVHAEEVADPRNAVDHRNAGVSSIPVGIVSRSALALMLDGVGYDLAELDWRDTVADFSECDEYQQGGRGTFVATRR